jgi:hypothetical protein
LSEVLAASPLAILALLLLWGESHTVHVVDLTSVIGSPIFRRLYLAKSIPFLPRICRYFCAAARSASRCCR